MPARCILATRKPLRLPIAAPINMVISTASQMFMPVFNSLAREMAQTPITEPMDRSILPVISMIARGIVTIPSSAVWRIRFWKLAAVMKNGVSMANTLVWMMRYTASRTMFLLPSFLE